ncbi:phosphoglycerate kinase [Paracholeplasma manati]|jgi:phosphoglycerate kinase|uniref:Phosphoglycerate kinase n=2 Tax=Paracholeplasma manati TaxID=591373 RepID=A0ABT2Y7R8_9MOLU|nr:phosphoglycerate kinase [Paracholeplasma manati]MCV2232797.1 phosphoglycerate kinase [Paracholeplasma manati]MDG0888706.1 phosphoglycerate kinase [Paracholeplasma manati]MDX9807906.1 phosphoglycerate kinase [Acholeplasma sp.]
MGKKTVRDINVSGKKVLIRVDFNVPMQDGKITDENRIVEALPTIKYVLEKGGRAILFSHLGRVKTAEDKKDATLAPVAARLSELLAKPVQFVPETRGAALEAAINGLKDGEILMFENTRFEDIEGNKESKNNPELGKYWASLGDVFVNDAFGTAHRAHASNAGIAANIQETVAGFLLEKEIEFIGGAVSNPKRPFVAVLGGAKVSDKIEVISNLLKVADKVIIGGGMAYTFLKAQGYEVGTSICELEKVALAKSLLEEAQGKIVLPIDFAYTEKFENEPAKHVGPITDIQPNEMSLDIGPKSIELFASVLATAKTVVWNGPMGVFEMSNYAKGTIGVCDAISKLQDAITIVGGGDSAAAAIQFGYASKFTHISTGGGASLEYLEGKLLPGVEIVANK